MMPRDSHHSLTAASTGRAIGKAVGSILVWVLLLAITRCTPGFAQTPTPGGDCCAIHSGDSCDTADCRSCVCDVSHDPDCCADGGRGWDEFCLATASDECNGVCNCQAPVTTPTPGGDCCRPHDGTACDGSACQQCVCGIDPLCCNTAWDATCVFEAGQQCGADCPCDMPSATPTPAPGDDCCSAHSSPSCGDDTCRACVCDKDTDCCEETWDATCAQEAAIDCALMCASCAAPGDCCLAHDGVSCADVDCKSCVCDTDSACCLDAWDERCVQEAGGSCALSCTCVPPGSCCAAHQGAGCAVDACQECVCGIDAVCCNTVWDGRCADEATDPCGASCRCSTSGCTGDCDGDGQVTVSNLITAVNIALGSLPITDCAAIDSDGDGDVTVSELIQAVNAALIGCVT